MARKKAAKTVEPESEEPEPTFPVAASRPPRMKVPKRAISKGFDPEPKPTGELPEPH